MGSCEGFEFLCKPSAIIDVLFLHCSLIVSGQEWEAKAVYASNGRLERTVLWYEIGIHVQDLQVREKTIKLPLKFQSSEFP